MVLNQVQTKKYGFNAIFSIALCALFSCASAQNSSLNSTKIASATDIRDANELAERERIVQERGRATQAYADAKTGCYQKFQVNACLTQARNQHNAQQADLKRQEVGLNDQQRKRRGAEQLQRTEDKTLVQREQEMQRQQGKAQEDGSKRQQRQADRKSAPNAAQAPSQAPTARPANSAAKLARAQEKAAAQQQRAANAAQAKAASQARLKEAAERRVNAQKRLEKSGKKPASPLPMPVGS